MIFLFFISQFLIETSIAHPVTFKGGTSISSIHRPKMTNLQVNYTFHRHVALASSFIQLDFDGDEYDVKAPIFHVNLLLKRWNKVGSQANIYAMTGVGYNFLSESTSNLFAYTAVQLDYETPRIYTALQGFTLISDRGSHLPYGARYRFGIAPYIAHSKFKGAI